MVNAHDNISVMLTAIIAWLIICINPVYPIGPYIGIGGILIIIIATRNAYPNSFTTLNCRIVDKYIIPQADNSGDIFSIYFGTTVYPEKYVLTVENNHTIYQEIVSKNTWESLSINDYINITR